MTDDDRTSSAAPDLPHPSRTSIRILVIDDDETDRMAARRALRQSGLPATVSEAARADEAMDLLRSSAFDCVLLDYHLPGVEGLVLLREIHDIAPDVPVVMLTGRGDQETAVELMKAGAADYLPKASLSPERLDASVRHALELARATAARRRAEEELQEQEAHFRTLANAIPQLAWMADTSGHRYWYNRRWFEYTGLSEEQSVGWGWTAAQHPEHRERVIAGYRNALEHGEQWEETHPIRGQDGQYRWFLSRAVPIRDESSVTVRWFGTNTDITAQREAEEERERLLIREQSARTAAEEALKVRDALISFATHDLRTPLTAIKGHAQLLERLAGRNTLTPQRLKDGLAAINAATVMMETLIGELLDSARLHAGQQIDLNRQPTDLVALARHNAVAQQQTTGRHTIEVIAPEETLTGNWDPVRLERVLGNLLSNAIKYSPNGGRITVTVQPRPGAPGWAELAVQDEGLGIPAADLPHVFTQFHRAANVAGRFSGSGIGLAGVRQVVEQHRGSVSVSSREGEGSTFTVLLPLEAPAADPPPEG